MPAAVIRRFGRLRFAGARPSHEGRPITAILQQGLAMQETSGYRRICTAIADGDVGRLRALAARDVRAAAHWRPIMDAALSGRTDLLRVLLDAGADPNVVAANGRHTALTGVLQRRIATGGEQGRETTVELLLRAGADPNRAAGPHRWVPLAYAAFGGLRRCITLLKRHGAELTVHLAGALHDRACLQRFLRHRGAANAADPGARSPLHYVARSRLWQHDELGSRAALSCARMLIEHGADIDAVERTDRDAAGATALRRAVSIQHLALARLLLEAGADPNSAVWSAAMAGTDAMRGLLDDHGANWDLEQDGRTVLIVSIRGGDSQAVIWLLAHGADPNRRDRQRRTALHHAAIHGVAEDCVAALLAAGAERDALDAERRTPLDYACELGHEGTIALLAS
jgi:ankyrin repeat protein